MDTIKQKEHIKIVIGGSVDAGKSTLVGTLTTGKLDDGRGGARASVLLAKHEKESGRTTNISYNYMRCDSESAERDITLIDLAGHEKYLKTTMFGITGLTPDYGIVIVESATLPNIMTREHLKLLMYLSIPVIILLTKKDVCPDDKYLDIRERLKRMMKNNVFSKFGRSLIFIDNDTDYDYLYSMCSTTHSFDSVVPVITISSKTGLNIDRLKTLFSSLPLRHSNLIRCSVEPIVDYRESTHYEQLTHVTTYIESVYSVKGIGLVITGSIPFNCPAMRLGDTFYMGPYGVTNPIMVPFKIKSMHDNFRTNTDISLPGENFCANIRFTGKISLTKKQIRKGMVITQDPNSVLPLFSRRFRMIARLLGQSHKTTLGLNYNATIHCKTIRQCAKIVEIGDIEKISNGIETIVTFEYMMRPEFIEIGSSIFFRDGTTRGEGKILEIIPHENTLPDDSNTRRRHKHKKKIAKDEDV
jgi:elongation factor 1-alpha